jgi:hypothetical protein
MIAYGSRVRLVSRQGVEHTERFCELSAAVAALMCRGCRCIGDARCSSRETSDARMIYAARRRRSTVSRPGRIVKERGYEGVVTRWGTRPR